MKKVLRLLSVDLNATGRLLCSCRPLFSDLSPRVPWLKASTYDREDWELTLERMHDGGGCPIA